MLDQEIVEEVLKKYGLTLEQVIGAKQKTPKAEQDWIYLIHHMHPPKKASAMETLHHCFMFEKKSLKGKQYEQMHIKDDKIFKHGLMVDDTKEAPEVVYDHLNNSFRVALEKINKKEYAVITGPIKLSKVRWSEQDRS